MDIITAKLGANMAISELVANRQIGYEEPAVMEKLFECTIPADGSAVRIEGPIGLRTDCDYRVTVDGKAYDCFVGYGEMVHIEGCDEDYPVSINGNWDYNEGTIIYPYYLNVRYNNPNEQGTDGHVIVEMVVKEATIHTIDEKYLPSGGGSGSALPVVEISTAINVDNSSTYISDSEAAKFTAFLEAGMPFIIKFPIAGQWYNGMSIVGIANIQIGNYGSNHFSVSCGEFVYKTEHSSESGWRIEVIKVTT